MDAVPAFALHLPTLITLCVVVMGSAAAIMSLFGLSQRIYRGYWWWVSAMWLAAGGGALQLLRPHWPGAAVPGNLLLLAWPVLIVTGLRRFHTRGRAPSTPLTDPLLLLLGYLPWLAAWASPALQGARTTLFCAAMTVLHLYAAWFVLKLEDCRRSPALKLLAAVMTLQTLLPLGAVAAALVNGPPQLPGQPLLTPVVVMPTMLAMLFTVYLCLVLTHERTERDLRETQRQLRVLADIDMLTQVPNRRHFEELAGAALDETGCAVLMLFDIDHFKRINDGFGHAVGDDALRLVARCARETLRTRDVIGRIGGDEFMLLLPGASVDDALHIADRITGRLDSERRASQSPALGLSFGVVSVEPAESLESAQQRADLALYEAKRQGRRRAVRARREGPDTVFEESRRLGLTPM
jgi:diguanylate cyclase (GGDEF)-like protein